MSALITICLCHPTGMLLLRLYCSSTLLSELLLVAARKKSSAYWDWYLQSPIPQHIQQPSTGPHWVLYLISRAPSLIVSFSQIPIKAAMANLRIFLLISLSLCHIWISAGHGQNSYNFMCDCTPQQHDRILRNAIMNLERGDPCIIYYYICMLHNVYIPST